MSDIHFGDTLLFITSAQQLKNEEPDRLSFKACKERRKKELESLLEKFRLQRFAESDLSEDAKKRNENMRIGVQKELELSHENQKMQEEESLTQFSS